MGVVVLMQDRRDRLHRVFFLLCIMIAFVAFAEFGYRQAESAEIAEFWLKMSQGAPVIIPMIAYFAGVFTGSIAPGVNPYIVAGLFIPALFFCFVDFFTNALSGNPLRTSWGWGQSISQNLWYHLYAVWSTVLLAGAAFLSIRYYLTIQGRKRRNQAKYIALAVSLIVFITIVIDTGMYYVHIQLPECATLGYAVANLVIAYAIRRHRLFVLNPLVASDTILETMSDALFLILPDGSIAHANKAARVLFHEEDDRFQGNRFENFIRTDTPFLKRSASGVFGLDAVMGDTPAETVLSVNGKAVPLSIAGKTMYDNDGEVLGTVVTMRDISERVDAEMALRESHCLLEERVRQRTEELRHAYAELADERERLATTLRSIGDGVITSDLQGSIVFLNKAAEALTGWSTQEATGQPVRDVLNITSRNDRLKALDLVNETIASGMRTELSTPVRLKTRNGDEKIIDDSTAPIKNYDGVVIGVVIVFRDVTEKEKLEEELFRAKRMESIAVLAGGIAHDFNNLLTGINNNLFMCKMAAHNNSDVVGIVNKSEVEILRAQQLAMQLLTFAQGGEPILAICSPRALVEESIGFFMSGSDSAYDLQFDTDLMNIRMDRGMMEQALSNLIVNAEQAMPGGGTVFVSAHNAIIDEKRVDREKQIPVHVPPGTYVRINVRDNGTGIPEDIRDKVFDPFFSTKGSGRGLGLSIAQSIIRKHGGAITIEPGVDKGTSFLLYLPAIEASAPEQVDVAQARLPDFEDGGGGKILLMDDEKTIRQTTGKILEMMGYRVATAADGNEAVALYHNAFTSGAPFDLVILDLTVPGGMGGRECLKRLVEIDPEVNAIVSSGYSTDAVMAKYVEYGFRGVLRKPYAVESLQECVREVLG